MNNRLLGTYLDLARFVAALIVLVAHARFTAIGPGMPAGGAGTRLLYALTGQSHGAVIAFFVISGFLVGGKLFHAGEPGFLPRYAIDRVTRLYTVALPVLLIAFALAGLSTALYGQSFRMFGTPCVTTPGDLLGMLAMLHQGMGVDQCLNAPIWTLAYEAFYYAFFAAVAVAVARWRDPLGWCCAAVAVALGGYALLEPGSMIGLSTVWLLGMAMAQRSPWQGRGLAFTGAVLVAFAVQAVTRHNDAYLRITEIVVTLGMAGSIALLRRWTPVTVPARLAAAAGAGAALSYSLYLSHAPAIGFARSVARFDFGIPVIRPVLTPTTLGLWAVLTLVGLAAGIAIWWLFERHTLAIRQAIKRRLGYADPAAHQPIPAEEGAPR